MATSRRSASDKPQPPRRKWDRKQLVIVAVSLAILGLFLFELLAPLITR